MPDSLRKATFLPLLSRRAGHPASFAWREIARMGNFDSASSVSRQSSAGPLSSRPARAICVRTSGTSWRGDDRTQTGCRVGGSPSRACLLAADHRVDRVWKNGNRARLAEGLVPLHRGPALRSQWKSLLTTESCRRPRSPPFGGACALGWRAVDREPGGGKVQTHAGRDTMNCGGVDRARQKPGRSGGRGPKVPPPPRPATKPSARGSIRPADGPPDPLAPRARRAHTEHRRSWGRLAGPFRGEREL